MKWALISASAGLLSCFLIGASARAGVENFSLNDAYREDLSPQRLRVSLNGLWRFQGARDVAGSPPTAGWQYLRVPGRWDAAELAFSGFTVTDAGGHVVGDWLGTPWSAVNEAWYQRELIPPADCAGRRITLRFEHVGFGVDPRIIAYTEAPAVTESLKKGAVLWLNGARVEPLDEWRADVTALIRPDAANTLSVGVASNGRGTRWGKGLNGDVWLECEPVTRIADVQWSTSFPDRMLALAVTARNGSDAPANLRLRAVLDNVTIGEVGLPPLAARSQGSVALQKAVPSLAAWSEFAPKLTPLRLELLNGSTVIDSDTVQIGMRDWRISGNAITLNGEPIALRTESGPDLGYGMEVFDRQFMRNYLTAYRSANYNGLRTLWGIVPDFVYDLTDRLGLMVQLVLPSPAMFRARNHLPDNEFFWTAYEAELTAQIARVRNHVSVVAYDLWAHDLIDRLQNQPDNLDGTWVPHVVPGTDSVRASLLRAASILNRLDPSREVLFDEASNLGKTVDVHPYFDFSMPLQEWEDWPEHRADKGSKPLLVSEFSIPYIRSWTEWNPLNWESDGGASFVIENAARYLGDDAYLRSRSAMLPADWRARGEGYVPETAIDPGLTERDGSVTSYRPNEAAEQVEARFATRVYRAWRVARLHIGPFHHDTMTGPAMLFRPLDAALAAADAPLKAPGPKPDRPVKSAQGYLDTTLPVVPAAWQGYTGPAFQPTKVYDATKAAFSPVLIYIGGGAVAGVTSKDHAYVAGEPIDKTLVVVNDGPGDAHISAHWALTGAGNAASVQQGDVTVTAPRGKTTLVPIHMTAPAVADRTDYRLALSATSDGTAPVTDSVGLQIFPAALPPLHLPADRRVALYDKSGATVAMLDAMGVPYRRIDRLGSDLDADLLVIGAGSLDASAEAVLPLLQKGLSVLQFEQRVGAPTARAAATGFDFETTHMAASATRNVFVSDAASPVLAGLKAEDLADWRGTSDMLPAFTPASGASYLYEPGGEAGIKSSNRGIVASYVLSKPQRGNFRVIVSSGFDLRQTPLVEYFVGRGHLLALQLDVTRRYGSDPVATRVARNAVAYMATPTPGWARTAYLGDPGGKKLFDEAGAQYRDLGAQPPAALDGIDTLLVGQGAAAALREARAQVLAWVERGGKLLLCDDVLTELGAGWFPDKVALVPMRLTLGRLPAGQPLLRGLNQSDAYYRDGLAVTRVDPAGMADEPAPVRILHRGQGVIATLPLASTAAFPTGAKPAADKVARLVSTVLTNAGVALNTPFALYPKVMDLAGEWRFATDPRDSGAAAGWYQPDFDDANWRSIKVPALWGFEGVTEAPSAGGFAYDGVAWYRRKVAIPADWKTDKAPLTLVIGGLSDTGDIYWNAKLVARGENRSYVQDKLTIPIDDALVPYGGTVTIAIRIVDKGPAGGLAGVTRIEKDMSWLSPRTEIRYGEKFPNFEPDANRSW